MGLFPVRLLHRQARRSGDAVERMLRTPDHSCAIHRVLERPACRKLHGFCFRNRDDLARRRITACAFGACAGRKGTEADRSIDVATCDDSRHSMASSVLALLSPVPAATASMGHLPYRSCTASGHPRRLRKASPRFPRLAYPSSRGRSSGHSFSAGAWRSCVSTGEFQTVSCA